MELGRGENWQLLRHTANAWHVDFYVCVGLSKDDDIRSHRDRRSGKSKKRGKVNRLLNRSAVESFQWDPPSGWEKEYGHYMKHQAKTTSGHETKTDQDEQQKPANK